VKEKQTPTQKKPVLVAPPPRTTEDEPMDGITVFLKKKKHAEWKEKRKDESHPSD
jgi:hypothetical protein